MRPDIVVSCAAYTRVDDTKNNPYDAMRANGVAPGRLTAMCRVSGARFLHISTDYVFDGKVGAPSSPTAATHPLNVYGNQAGRRATSAGGGHQHDGRR